MESGRRIAGSFAKLFLYAVLAAFAIILLMRGFGWFASIRDPKANGQGLQTKENQMLEIRAVADGEDIGVTVVEQTMDKLPTDGAALHPDVSGSFTFYVHDGSDGTVPYAFRYGVCVENNQFHEGANFPEGFYPNTSDEEREAAKQYINAHLLFFTNYENGEYSGWISPGLSVRESVDPPADSSPYQVTVYWVWVSWYQQIFEKNSGLIAEKTRQEIEAYFSQAENLGKMFVDGIDDAESYNGADTLIGMTLKYICFQVEVCKE